MHDGRTRIARAVRARVEDLIREVLGHKVARSAPKRATAVSQPKRRSTPVSRVDLEAALRNWPPAVARRVWRVAQFDVLAEWALDEMVIRQATSAAARADAQLTALRALVKALQGDAQAPQNLEEAIATDEREQAMRGVRA